MEVSEKKSLCAGTFRETDYTEFTQGFPPVFHATPFLPPSPLYACHLFAHFFKHEALTGAASTILMCCCWDFPRFFKMGGVYFDHHLPYVNKISSEWWGKLKRSRQRRICRFFRVRGSNDPSFMGSWEIMFSLKVLSCRILCALGYGHHHS